LFIIILGDSRAIICRDGKAIRLTKDHKPHDPIERARIESHDGGFVAKSATGCYRVNGSLAVARYVFFSISKALEVGGN